MSKIEVDTIAPQSGTEVTVGESGDTVKTGTGTSLVVQGDGSSTNGIITLNCSQNSHGVKIESPDHSGGQSYTLKLPETNITAGKFLKVDSITGSGSTAVGQLSFADEPGGGKVLQVVTATDSTERTTTSSSFVTASNTLSVDITPSSTSNKILVICSVILSNNTGGNHMAGTIFRDTTNLGTSGGGLSNMTSVSGVTAIYSHATMTILDSPSSTSELTYQLYVRTNGTGTGRINTNPFGGATNNAMGTITAFEIAG